MNRKERVILSDQQKLEYAKMMVEDGYSNQQIQEISGACSSAVVRWKRQYKAEKQGITPHNQKAITPEQQRIQELKKQLACANEKAYSYFSVSELCRVFGFPESCYYYKKSQKLNDVHLRHQIRVATSESNYTYGKRRIQQELAALSMTWRKPVSPSEQ